MKSQPTIPTIFTFVFTVGLSCAAFAQEVGATSGNRLWELGGFGLGVSQQAYPGSDQQVNRVLALPFFIYRGELFRADRDTAGIRALKSSQYELDVGVAGSFGSSKAIEARNGMRKLGTQVELGPRLKWNLGAGPGGGVWRAEFPLRGVFDLSDGAASRGLSFEPKLIFERQTQAGWRYSTSVSAIVADAKLARTFYEVSSSEATAQRAAYAAKSGLVAWRLSSSLSRELNADTRVFAFGRIDTVAGATNETSPLIRKKTGASVGLGLTYTWMRSQAQAYE